MSYYKRKKFQENKKQKINPDDIDFIRDSKGKIKQMDLAAMFNVTQGWISNIQKQ